VQSKPEPIERILEAIASEASLWIHSRTARPELRTLLDRIDDFTIRMDVAAIIEAVLPQCKSTEEARSRLLRAFGLLAIESAPTLTRSEWLVDQLTIAALVVVLLSISAAVFSSVVALVR